MKKLDVILFKNKSEEERFSSAICEKLSRENLSAEQEFCGIWGEIEFNREECLKTISATINYFLRSDKTEVYFGCSEKDKDDIIALVDKDNCKVNLLSCSSVL